MHYFQICDTKGKPLIDHCHITLVDLKKLHSQGIHNTLERWLQFFNQAEHFDDLALSDWMNTQEMKQAMNTLSRFSEQDREYFAYQARQEYIRQQNTIAYEREQEDIARQEVDKAQQDLENALQEAGKARQETEESEQEKMSALAELAELKKRLATQKYQH